MPFCHSEQSEESHSFNELQKRDSSPNESVEKVIFKKNTFPLTALSIKTFSTGSRNELSGHSYGARRSNHVRFSDLLVSVYESPAEHVSSPEFRTRR
jgi:hypothetical protein